MPIRARIRRVVGEAVEELVGRRCRGATLIFLFFLQDLLGAIYLQNELLKQRIRRRDGSINRNPISHWEARLALLKAEKVRDEEWKKTLKIWTSISEIIVEIPIRKCELLFPKSKNLNQTKKENHDRNLENQEKWITWIQASLEASNLEAEVPSTLQLEIPQEKVWIAFSTKVARNQEERKRKYCPQIITNHTTEESNRF